MLYPLSYGGQVMRLQVYPSRTVTSAPAHLPSPSSPSMVPVPHRSVLAPNYRPLDITLRSGEGVWLTDIHGHRYLDCLAGYSALNFGHSHPQLVEAAKEQASRLTLVSRAFNHDLLLPYAEALTMLTDTETMLPMNTGAEAVETAIKAARKWGYLVKGVPEDQADIIVAANAFHGRTTTIISFSTDPSARDHYGPYTPGFTVVPYDDADAVAAAITPYTVAILIEPIQGEAGVIIPAPSYLPSLRALATDNDVLLIADEIQSGLARTGYTLDEERVGVAADLITLGKALGGGLMPVSAVVGRHDVLSLMTVGTHGSTFGGNPLACRIGMEVVAMLSTGEFQQRARDLEGFLGERLAELVDDGLISSSRHVGLWAGIDANPALGLTGRQICEGMQSRGVLAKDTHGSTIRFAPPLVIERDELATALDALADTLHAARR